jgi:hypothetical protein
MGFQFVAKGAMAKNASVTSGKIAIQVIKALAWIDGGFGPAGMAGNFSVGTGIGESLRLTVNWEVRLEPHLRPQDPAEAAIH